MAKLNSLTEEQWEQVYKAREEWLAIGLSTEPADRPRAEAAVAEMYRLLDKSVPEFVWTKSPKESLKLGAKLEHTYWGSLEAYWVAYYSIPEALGFVTYTPESSHLLSLWREVTCSAGAWHAYENQVILSERPSEIHMENPGRLHNGTGPAVLYPDGWSLYAWHGTRVPKDLIEEGWSVERVLKESNVEIRRCAIERVGWDKFILDAGLKKLTDEVDDPGNPGQTLSLYDVPTEVYSDHVHVLLCTNGTEDRDGTRHRFGLTVPANINDPVAAAAWTFDWPVETYRELEVRR